MAAPTRKQAEALVKKYIDPSDCFVVFQSTKLGWAPLSGTPCAHYVSHVLGLKVKPGTGGYGCAAGYELRVKALVAQLNEVALADVKLNDVWARLKGDARAGSSSKEPTDHCGLVIAITPAAKAGEKPTISIRHNSSGQQSVATNDWGYFDHGGKFYRPPSAAAGVIPPGVQANMMRAANGLALRTIGFIKG